MFNWTELTELFILHQTANGLAPRTIIDYKDLRNGGSAFAVQKQLGHATLEMSRRYISLTQSDVTREHQTFTPLNT